ncbi:SH3 domain-containing protein [Treponema sp. OttesenSCG-928-L16]|nr:SH3 domain-containing protein [Treponema sp. OttesenSCG-928-L16]
MKGSIFRLVLPLVILSAAASLLSCSRLLGYGVLLWATEDPSIPSGTVLPVYIRSNIDQVWVAGIPDEYRARESSMDKFEIPLWQMEFLGSRKKAEEWAASFAEYASAYAETLQDGLPIRKEPDNGAQRVYRLRQGQIIKILSESSGTAAISATGDPLPGGWYKVLTEDGTTGYCFSYRLRMFEYSGGPLAVTVVEAETKEDPELERVLSLSWSPEWYGTMVSSGRIDIEELSQHWGFFPGQDTGIAHLSLPDNEKLFSYTSIKAEGNRSWRFEGSSLQMSLRSDTVLTIQYTETGGAPKTYHFVVLPVSVEDIIMQETERRNALIQAVYRQGPVFRSSNYGVLSFDEDGNFTWTGYNLLVPSIIPASASGKGKADMRLFLPSSMQSSYDGAFTLRFGGSGGNGTDVNFLYTLDSQGLRIEYVPDNLINGSSVSGRASSPIVIYFFRSES